MSPLYDNFDLRITQDEQVFAVSQIGEAGPERFDLDRNQLALALEVVEAEGANPRLVRELGQTLYQALFSPPIQVLHARSLDAAPEGRLRLRLRIEPDWLAALPWEFLHDGQSFWGLSSDTPIMHLPGETLALDPLQVEGPLRVLVIIASPVNYPDLHREQQADQLKSTFSRLQTQGLLEVEFLPHATRANLIRTLRTGGFHVLHYLGYSAFNAQTNQNVILFEEENGVARRVSADDLHRWLRRESALDLLRLVLINDAERSTAPAERFSLPFAMRLVELGIPAALAMRYPLPDAVSHKFAARFCEEVARGRPVDAAAAEGRAEIHEDLQANLVPQAPDTPAPGEWGAPVLFMRTKDGQLFQPPKALQVETAPSSELVYAAIEGFKVETRDPVTRFFLDQLPLFTVVGVVATCIYWLIARIPDLLFFSGVAVAYGCLWLLRTLFREKVPSTFRKLWDRRLLIPRDGANLAEDYRDFLDSYNSLLNDQRYSWITRAIGLGIALVTVWNLNYQVVDSPWRYLLQAVAIVLSLLAGYILGTLLWKMIATVLATRWLSFRFDLDIRPTRADGCGGLKPLGDLYFANAQVLLLAGLFTAFWVLVFVLTPVLVANLNLPPRLESLLLGYSEWLAIYQALLVILALVALITFVFPMINTCRIMREKKVEFQEKANSLAREIAELEDYVEKYEHADSEQTAEINSRLEWLEDRYLHYDRPPLWPFDPRVRFRMAGSLFWMSVSLVASQILESFVDGWI
jgi:hypothetical protein